MMNALQDIEEANAQRGIGTIAVRVYRGARDETEIRPEAFWATVAVLVAMFKNGEHTGNEDES